MENSVKFHQKLNKEVNYVEIEQSDQLIAFS